MADNRFASVSGIVIKDNKVLLVRQTYGAAKGLLVIPGGYLAEGEMPNIALEREILEEAGIVALTKDLLAIRFSKRDWWAIFSADYVSGEAVSDGSENNEVLFLDFHDAISRTDLTSTTKEILSRFVKKNNLINTELTLSDFCPEGMASSDYQLFI